MLLRSTALVCAVASALHAQSPRSCTDDPAETARVRRQWERVSPVLASTRSVRTQRLLPLAVTRFERSMDRNGVARSEIAVPAQRYGIEPFPTAPVARLSAEGFTTTDSVGATQLRGPDEAFLLSPEFLRDHCFRVVEGQAETAGLTALAFRPSRRSSQTQLNGFFWGDADVPLRFLRFSYSGSPAVEAAGVGGRMLFEQLAGGQWIVREWVMRAPVVTQAGQLLGFREEGGEAFVVSSDVAAMADSVQNARKPPGRVRGVVLDSLTRRAFIGASVWADTGLPRTRSDTFGVFTLSGLSVGTHVVAFSHPMLDSIGVRPRRSVVRVGPDSTSVVLLAGPSYATLRGSVCPDAMAIATGTVRDVVTGVPIDSARVTLSWIEIEFADNKLKRLDPRTLDLTTDRAGRYAACVPRTEELTGVVSAPQGGAARTGMVDFKADDRGLAIQGFTLDRSASDTLFGTATIRGVVRFQDGTPVANASVRLSDPVKTAVTDSGGRFGFAAVPGGTRSIDARAIGHAPVRLVTEVRPDRVNDVEIYMRKVTLLDPVLVRAAADDRSAQILSDLENRRKANDGYRLTQKELLTFRNAGMDAVVRALPFVRIKSANNRLQVTLGGRNCEPTLWLDGQRAELDVLYLVAARDVVEAEVFIKGSQVPMRFRSFSSCGAILVWTRESVRGG